MSLLINRFYRFGDFTLDTDQRVLLREGKPVALTPKVFDTLLILVENSGRIVEKEDLMRRLWPDTFVEESNLTFNIQQLRKSLADNARDPRYVGTVARRGYRFIAAVELVPIDESQADGQDTRPFAASDKQSTDDTDRSVSPLETPESESVINPATEIPASTPKTNLAVTAVAETGPQRTHKRSLAIATAIVVALAVVGIVFWRFSNGLIGDRGEGEGVAGKPPAALPLKLEKLTATGQSRLVAISPDGKHIAYTLQVEARTSIWLRQLATNTNVEIVPGAGRIFGLEFANSGEYLYFVKGDPTALYRISLFGGVPTKLIDELSGKFSISADDRQIAIIRPAINRNGLDEVSLVIANSDGTAERTLLVAIYPNDLDVPLWTPDGGGIVCAYGSSVGGGQDVSLVEVNTADGTKKELSTDRFFHISKMAWLPQKNDLLMAARKNLADNNQLWRVSYPGMEISRITDELSGYLDLSSASNADKAVASQATRISDIWVGPSREPKDLKKITQAIDTCWTPDGRLIYSSTASGNCDIWIMQPDGLQQRQLTVNAAVNQQPGVAPDNSYIVFTSNRTGTFQVWRMNPDGVNQIPLTNGAAASHPRVSPDGRWVFYNTTDDWHIWKVSIEGGEPLEIVDYIASRPSISPDGKMIACLGRDESQPQILILPVEGGRPLKRIDYSGASVSGTRIEWTPDGKALVYAARAGRTTAIVRRSLDGGPTQERISIEQDELFDFGYSIDGQFLALTRGGWQHDIVLISDLQSTMKPR
jgi:Tol biopolymer transport system component/DNA-binding winged helix-turn-helix (wHTH) protein